jgi:integrase
VPIRKRNLKWQADTISPIGTRVRKSFATKEEAERYLSARRQKPETPARPAANGLEYLRRASLAPRSNRREPAKALRLALGARAAENASATNVAMACASWEHLKPSTRIGYHCGLRKVLEAIGAPIASWRGIPHIKAPSAREVTVPDAAFEATLAQADLPMRFVLLAARECALRSGTIYRIRPCNIVDGHFVVKTKNGQTITVPISPRLMALMAAAVAVAATPETPVLEVLGLKASNFWKSVIAKRLLQYRTEANAGRWTLHDLRRTAARRLYDETGDLRVVQSLLGHSNLTASLHYLGAASRPITAAESRLLLSRQEVTQ